MKLINIEYVHFYITTSLNGIKCFFWYIYEKIFFNVTLCFLIDIEYALGTLI